MQVIAAAELELRSRLRERESFDLWLRRVSPGFSWNPPHLVHIRAQLERITRGECRRMMLFVPPRHGKSEMTTVRYPVWRMLRDQTMSVIIAAYNQTLAETFSRKARNLARSYMAIDDSRRAVNEWMTAQGGVMRAVGVGTGVTGKGGHLIVIDDPVKSREEANSAAYRERVWNWYRDDLYTRLEPDGAIILTMTRWHEDDLAGRILASDNATEWSVVSLPALAEAHDPLNRAPGEALWPDRFDVAALERIRVVLGESSFAALYQQRPTPAGGEIFRSAWWGGESEYRNRFHAESSAHESNVVARWQFWDTALKAERGHDYSACATFSLLADYRLSLTNMWQQRIESALLPAKIEEMATMANRDGKLRGVVIEDKTSGTTSIQTLRMVAPDWLATIIAEFSPHGTKEYRARQASIWCERGCVLLPVPSESVPWLYDFADPLHGQLFRFPATAHDDMVDAFVMGVLYLEHLLAEGWHARLQYRTESSHELAER